MQLQETLFSPALEIVLHDVSTVVKMRLPSDISKSSTAESKFRIFKNKNVSADIWMVTQALV
jgi:hypothetical protein